MSQLCLCDKYYFAFNLSFKFLKTRQLSFRLLSLLHSENLALDVPTGLFLLFQRFLLLHFQV